MKVAPEPVMSEVVRQRLELLLAEVRPRHALDEPEVGFIGTDDDRFPGSGQTGAPSPETTEDRRARHPPGPGAPAGEAGPRPQESMPGGAADRVVRRVREFTKEHLAAVLVVLAVGCSWTVYTLLQARSTPVAVAPTPSVLATPTPPPSAPPRVLVHVVGAVREPGLVELAEGSRVADVITAAGGLLNTADPGELNLAAVVGDGSQVVIGTRGKPRGEVREAGGGTASGTSGPGSPSRSGAVSLNTASLEQLDGLPGVGPVTAQKILDWRTRHGRFSSVRELQEVDGIGPKTYADIAPHVRV